MPTSILSEYGGRHILYWAPTQEEANHGLRNCPGLTDNEMIMDARIVSDFLRDGRFKLNEQKVKKVEGQDFFELKLSKQLRAVGDYLKGGKFVIFYCVRKKNGYSKKQLKQAQKLHASCLEELK